MWDILVLLLTLFLIYYFQKKRPEVKQTERLSSEVKNKRGKIPPLEYTVLQDNRVELVKELVPEKNEKLSSEVSKKRRKIAPPEYAVLHDNRVEMVNKLVHEKLVPILIQNKVFYHDDVEGIQKKCKDLRRKGAETMLGIVYNSGSMAFEKLIEVLQQTGYQELAQKLTTDLEKKTISPNSANIAKQRGCLSGIELEVLKDNHERLVNELDSSVLKNHLFQNNLIDDDDLEKITKKEEELRREGAEEMITIIYNSGSDGFLGLIKSLAEAGYEDLSSKLLIDFHQKKDMVAFPDYPFEPELEMDRGSNSISDWKQKLTKWRKGDVSKLWCKAMNKWFENHKYRNEDELKMVVKHWLCKVEEVVDKGCLEIDEINLILNVTEKCQVNTSLLQFINEMVGCEITQENLEIESINLKTQKKRLHEQQRRVFENLKHNIEGIIEGTQNFEILPIDTESCKLAELFHSVVYDVREIWNKLH